MGSEAPCQRRSEAICSRYRNVFPGASRAVQTEQGASAEIDQPPEPKFWLEM